MAEQSSYDRQCNPNQGNTGEGSNAPQWHPCDYYTIPRPPTLETGADRAISFTLFGLRKCEAPGIKNASCEIVGGNFSSSTMVDQSKWKEGSGHPHDARAFTSIHADGNSVSPDDASWWGNHPIFGKAGIKNGMAGEAKDARDLNWWQKPKTRASLFTTTATGFETHNTGGTIVECPNDPEKKTIVFLGDGVKTMAGDIYCQPEHNPKTRIIAFSRGGNPANEANLKETIQKDTQSDGVQVIVFPPAMEVLEEESLEGCTYDVETGGVATRGKTDKEQALRGMPTMFLQLGQLIREYDQTVSEHGYDITGIPDGDLTKQTVDNFGSGPGEHYFNSWTIDPILGTQTFTDGGKKKRIFDTNFGASVEMFCDAKNGLWIAIGSPSTMKHSNDPEGAHQYKINTTPVTGVLLGVREYPKKGEDTFSADGVIGQYNNIVTGALGTGEALSSKKPAFVSIFNLSPSILNDSHPKTSTDLLNSKDGVTTKGMWLHHTYTNSQKYMSQGDPSDLLSGFPRDHSVFPEIEVDGETQTQNFDYRIAFHGVLETRKGPNSLNASGDSQNGDIEGLEAVKKLIIRFKTEEGHTGVIRKKPGASGTVFGSTEAEKTELDGLAQGAIASGGSGISVECASTMQTIVGAGEDLLNPNPGMHFNYVLREATITFDPRAKPVEIMKAVKVAFDKYFADSGWGNHTKALKIQSSPAGEDCLSGFNDFNANMLDSKSACTTPPGAPDGNPLTQIATGHVVLNPKRLEYGLCDYNNRAALSSRNAVMKSGSSASWPVGGYWEITTDSDRTAKFPTYTGNGELTVQPNMTQTNDGLTLSSSVSGNQVTWQAKSGSTVILEGKNYEFAIKGETVGWAQADDGLAIEFGAESSDASDRLTPVEPSDLDDVEEAIQLLTQRAQQNNTDLNTFDADMVYPVHIEQQTGGEAIRTLRGTFKIIRAFCWAQDATNNSTHGWPQRLEPGNPWFACETIKQDVFTGEEFGKETPVPYSMANMEYLFAHDPDALNGIYLSVVNDQGQLIHIAAYNLFRIDVLENRPLRYTVQADLDAVGGDVSGRQTGNEIIDGEGNFVYPYPDMPPGGTVGVVTPLFRFIDNLASEYSDFEENKRKFGGYGSTVPKHVLQRVYDKLSGKRSNPLEIPIWIRKDGKHNNYPLGPGKPVPLADADPNKLINPWKAGAIYEAASPSLTLASAMNSIKNELTIAVYDYQPDIAAESPGELPSDEEYMHEDGSIRPMIRHFSIQVHGDYLLKCLGTHTKPRSAGGVIQGSNTDATFKNNNNSHEIGTPNARACAGQGAFAGEDVPFMNFDPTDWTSCFTADYLKLPLCLGLGYTDHQIQEPSLSSDNTGASPAIRRECLVGKCDDGSFPKTGQGGMMPKIPKPMQSYDFRIPIRCPSMSKEERNELVQWYADINPYNKKKRSAGQGGAHGGTGRMIPQDMMNGGTWNNGNTLVPNSGGMKGCYGGPCGYVTLWKYNTTSNTWDFKQLIGGPKHIILETNIDDDMTVFAGREISALRHLYSTMSSHDKKKYPECTAMDYHTFGKCHLDDNGIEISNYDGSNTIIRGKGQRQIGQGIPNADSNTVHHYISEWGAFGVKTRFALEGGVPTLYVWEPNAKHYDDIGIVGLFGNAFVPIIPLLRAERGLRIHIFKYEDFQDGTGTWLWSGYENYNEITDANATASTSPSRLNNIASTKQEMSSDGQTIIQNGMGTIT